MGFAENLKKARKNAGLTQQQVAQAICVDRTTIAQYERGFSEPKLKNIIILCDLLNVNLEELTSD